MIWVVIKEKIMMRVLAAVGMVAFCIFNISCNSVDSDKALQPETTDIHKAISIAVRSLSGHVKSPCEYKLTGAEQYLHDGKYLWRVTFKPQKMLPQNPATQVIGAGGEVFVLVDTNTKETIITSGE